MPELLIDITRLLDRRMQGRLPTGVDRVSLEYVRHFGKHAVALVRYGGQWVELPRGDSRSAFASLLSPGKKFNNSAKWWVAKAFSIGMARRFSTRRFLFNTGHSGLEKPDYARRLRRSQLRPLFFVHDLIPIAHPEYCRSGESERHEARLNTVLELGAGIIANSVSTLQHLRAFADTNGRAMPPAVVAHLAPAKLRSLEVPELGRPYFVMLGTIEPRKNHWLMLHLWRQLIEQLGNTVPKLVIIGQRGWECENVVDMLERCDTLKGHVEEVSNCSDADLAVWLKGARALLFPTFAEGYGMPVVEALSLGVPVIASDLAVFREIAGDIPEYVNPLDGMRWRDLIREYAQPHSVMRANQLARMQSFVAPTWKAHFEQVEALMDRLSNDSR